MATNIRGYACNLCVLAVSVRRVGEGRSVRRPPGGASRRVRAAPWAPGSPRMVMLDALAF
jgi:hypothetical protein